MRSGMTLMSVMVAVALAGIVALAVARLLGNQSKTMSVVRLREQREELLKHYKNIVISGWDATRSSCSAAICARNGDAIIPTGGLYLADDLYEYEHLNPGRGTADRWWKVSVAKRTPSSGAILHADNYAELESLMTVEVTVEFIRKEHQVVNTRLAEREEIVFLHHNTPTALNANRAQCVSGHLTQQYKGPLSYAGPLYSGAGGIIQYDFNSDYTKCSQVPLVNTRSCPLSAIIGFLRTQDTGTLKEQLIKGRPICGKGDETNPIAAIRGATEKRTVGAINCRGQGYVEWMANDEIPKCVAGPAPGVRSARVAGESRIPPSATQTFTLVYKAQEKDCPTLADVGPPQYNNFTCDVPRYEGIVSFNDMGNVASYVSYWSDFKVLGPRGPTGTSGRCGLCDVPAGPPGPPGLCSCCCTSLCPGGGCPPCPPPPSP